MRRVHLAPAFLLGTTALLMGLFAVPASAATESLFAGGTPTVKADPDTAPVTLGTRITVKVPGKLTAVRFYKGSGNTGPHAGAVYSADGRAIVQGTFVNETASGWQKWKPAAPVRVAAGTQLVVAVQMPHGRYAAANAYGWPKSTPSMTGTAGVYTYGSGLRFPSSTYRSSNYFIDATFSADTTATSSPTPGSSTSTPSPGVESTAPAPSPSASTSPAATTGAADLGLAAAPGSGGSAYWSQFPKAKQAGWADPSFFPIAVFFGKPEHAPALKALGVNTYMGAEHDGSKMSVITDQGISVIAQTEWSRAEVGDNQRVVGWHASDECEMGYSGCTPNWSNDNGEYGRLAVQKDYVSQIRAFADGRFVQANFGNGVARTWWAPDTMDDHVRLLDASSVDKYVYTSPGSRAVVTASPDWPAGANPGSAAAYGWLEDQMERFQDPNRIRPSWVFVETARPFLTESDAGTITPEQIDGAVWSAIIHGAGGIAYFQHNNNGLCGGHSLVQCSQALKESVRATDAKVASLAPVINTPTYLWDFTAGTDTMLKVKDGSIYVFAGVGLKQSPGSKTFTLPAGVAGTVVEVVGEGRTLPVTAGRFTDGFAKESSTHVYKISIAPKASSSGATGPASSTYGRSGRAW